MSKGSGVDCAARDSRGGVIPAAAIRVPEQESADNFDGNYLYDRLAIIHRKMGSDS